jgi:micrococcal nuclease
MYEYKATVEKIIDGDTIDVMIDLGFYVYKVERVRLARINCPELSTPEGQVSKQFVIDYLAQKQVTIKTQKNIYDKYGRWIADVFVADQCLNDILLEKNLAAHWPAKVATGGLS